MKSAITTCVFALFLIGTWQVMDARQKRLDAKLHLMAQSQLAMEDRLESLEDRHDALLKAVCGGDDELRHQWAAYVSLTNGIIRAVTKTPSEQPPKLPPLTLRELSEARRLMFRYTTFHADNYLKRQERWLARFREGLKDKKGGGDEH